MTSKLIATDNFVTTEFHHDQAADKVVINRVQDVEPILDANKRAFNDATRLPQKSEFRHMARIPNVVVERLMKDGTWFDPARLERWMNDPDNKYFRTAPGRVKLKRR